MEKKQKLEVIKTYYVNGELKEKYEVIKGTDTKHGYYFLYWSNGKLRLKENYVNGILKYEKKKNNSSKFSISENIKKKLNRMKGKLSLLFRFYEHPGSFIIISTWLFGFVYYVSNILSGNEMPLYFHIAMIIDIILILLIFF